MTGKFNPSQGQYYPDDVDVDCDPEDCQQCCLCGELYPPDSDEDGYKPSESVVDYDGLSKVMQEYVGKVVPEDHQYEGDGGFWVCRDCITRVEEKGKSNSSDVTE